MADAWRQETINYITSKFREYYAKSAALQYPDRIAEREFGFLYFTHTSMQRHLAFSAPENLRSFLARHAPAHVYYSTAYYKYPAAANMDAKSWLRAELVFDLDADHLAQAKDKTYPEQLALVRAETLKLVEDFLVPEFGIAREDISVNFSGARGYHIHVRDQRFFVLDAYARRELVDYLKGEGLDYELLRRPLKPTQETETPRYRARRRLYRYELPALSAGGWSGRIARGVLALLDKLEPLAHEQRAAFFASYPRVGKKLASKLAAELFEPTALAKMRAGIFEVFSEDRLRNLFLAIVKQYVAVTARGEADEPVTSDTRRLIRLPGSLHGKTGFCVKPVRLEELHDHNPLVDCIVFSQELVRVETLKPLDVTLAEQRFRADKCAKIQLPEYAAIFACCLGLCKRVEGHQLSATSHRSGG
jgi:DNA primase small subunit